MWSGLVGKGYNDGFRIMVLGEDPRGRTWFSCRITASSGGLIFRLGHPNSTIKAVMIAESRGESLSSIRFGHYTHPLSRYKAPRSFINK
jgi:hypothetical protein